MYQKRLSISHIICRMEMTVNIVSWFICRLVTAREVGGSSSPGGPKEKLHSLIYSIENQTSVMNINIYKWHKLSLHHIGPGLE